MTRNVVGRNMGLLLGRALGVLLLAMWSACASSSSARDGAKPLPLPMGGARQEPVVAVDTTAVEARIRQRVLVALGREARRIASDGNLDAACRATSRDIAEGGDPDMIPAYLRHALHGEQVTDAAYLPFTFGMEPTDPVPEGLLTLVSSETTGRHMSHLGVGTAASADGQVIATVVLIRRMVRLSPFPRRVDPGSEQVLWGELASQLVQNPRIVMATPDGGIIDLLARPSGRRFMVTVPFLQGPGRYVIQVLAEDAYGPQVASQLEVDAGDVPPLPTMRLMPRAPPLDGTDRAALERQMVALVNDYRAAMGLARLQTDPRLVRSARSQSEDMRDSRYFGHRSPVKGELPQRLRDNGVPPALVLENIAMSVSIPWAHDRLVDSPSHRRALLDPRVTHIGVGVAVREAGPIQVVYVTEHLAALEGR